MRVELIRVISRLMLCAGCALPLATQVGCDRNPFAQSPTEQMRSELSAKFGPSLGSAIAEAWRPVNDAAADLEAASDAEDFAAYHAAVQRVHATVRPAVDETIRLLEADPSWRRAMFEEIIAKLEDDGGSFAQTDRSGGAGQLFPSFEESSGDWMQRDMMRNPRMAGEMVRWLLETQQQIFRLVMYITDAVGRELTNSMHEAVDGFQNPSGSTRRR